LYTAQDMLFKTGIMLFNGFNLNRKRPACQTGTQSWWKKLRAWHARNGSLSKFQASDGAELFNINLHVKNWRIQRIIDEINYVIGLADEGKQALRATYSTVQYHTVTGRHCYSLYSSIVL
jgi:hypothetical protein